MRIINAKTIAVANGMTRLLSQTLYSCRFSYSKVADFSDNRITSASCETQAERERLVAYEERRLAALAENQRR